MVDVMEEGYIMMGGRTGRNRQRRRNRRTDIVRVKLVHAHERRDHGELARVQVVHDNAVKLPQPINQPIHTRDTNTTTYADMAVHDKRDAEHAVEDRVVAPRGREHGGGERDDPRREQTFERPVMGAVRARWFRERRWVVHGSLDDRCGESVPATPTTGVENVRPPGVYSYGTLLVAYRAVVDGQLVVSARGPVSCVRRRTEQRSAGKGSGHRRRLLPKPVPAPDCMILQHLTYIRFPGLLYSRINTYKKYIAYYIHRKSQRAFKFRNLALVL